MDTRRWPRWAVVLAVGAGLFLYLRSPIDLLPDRMGPLGLLDDLVVLGVALWWLQRRLAEPVSAAPADAVTEPIPTDPWELLGIAPGATPDAITRAYRTQLKRHHPDRVAGLGDASQRLAHERTVAIQRAYRTLRGD
ncbi:MAG: J domain-containing protein [Deltaproteobacteria bacterium]|nr:J domain-containing protein [Deltaproteobacteria bacterium]